MRVLAVQSDTFRIWIAGDYCAAVQACREFTLCGLCVAIQPVDYVYTMGAEAGVCVTLINYPRFPKNTDEIESVASELGQHLCNALFQGSFSVEGPRKTTWFSRRNDPETEKSS